MQTFPPATDTADDDRVTDRRAGAAEDGPTDTGGDRRRSLLALAVLVVVLAVPLVVAVATLWTPRWYPSVDLAQTELRVRDVWSAHPPLTGLGGRIGEYGPDQGSHPGPLSFFSLSVFYRLLGSDSAALQAAAAALNIIAMALTLWLARRRGGPGLMLGTAAVLVTLAHAYGAYALTLAWNPYLPMLWWPVVLMGVWSLLCGDLAVLPVTVFAASFCMQTHVSYVGLVSAVGAIGLVAVGYWIYRHRREARELRRTVGWALLGSALAALLWWPPLAEQVTRSQGGNLSKLLSHFTDTPENPLGLRRGVEVVLSGFDPWQLLTAPVIEGRPFLRSSPFRGTLLLATWAAAAAASVWLRHRPLLRLHLLLAVVTVVAAGSASRIFGPPWAYLALWTWGIAAFIVLAVGWTAASLVTRLAPHGARRRLAELGTVFAVVLVVTGTARFTADAARVEHEQPELSESADHLVPRTIAALEEGSLPGTGRTGRYLVTWDDPLYLGGRGFALFNELDRAGFDVGAPQFYRAGVTRHRVVASEDATAQLHLAAGPEIEKWDAKPGYRQIVTYNPPAQAAGGEVGQLRAEVVEELEAAGRSDLVAEFEQDPRNLLDEEGFSIGFLDRVHRFTRLAERVTVFVGPPSTPP